jgi:hypothetical protein
MATTYTVLRSGAGALSGEKTRAGAQPPGARDFASLHKILATTSDLYCILEKCLSFTARNAEID